MYFFTPFQAVWLNLHLQRKWLLLLAVLQGRWMFSRSARMNLECTLKPLIDFADCVWLSRWVDTTSWGTMWGGTRLIPCLFQRRSSSSHRRKCVVRIQVRLRVSWSSFSRRTRISLAFRSRSYIHATQLLQSMSVLSVSSLRFLHVKNPRLMQQSAICLSKCRFHSRLCCS